MAGRARSGTKKKDTENAYLRAQLEEIISSHGEFRDFVDQRARHIRKLIVDYGQHLQVLQIRQAERGLDIEPYVVIEIQKIRTKLEELYRQAQSTTVRTDALIRQLTED